MLIVFDATDVMTTAAVVASGNRGMNDENLNDVTNSDFKLYFKLNLLLSGVKKARIFHIYNSLHVEHHVHIVIHFRGEKSSSYFSPQFFCFALVEA